MAYSLKLRQEASADFAEAYRWYEEQQTNLGESFKTAIDNKINRICSNPYHYKRLYKKYHEALIDRFPFLIVYHIDEKQKQIIVFAIFHTSRNPRKKYK